MNLIILGPQGSGKGTQAQLLSEKYGMLNFESGEIFREMVKGDSPYKEQLMATMNKGELVPDQIANSVIEDYLKKINVNNKSIIFDGFPRSLSQLKMLEEFLLSKGEKIDGVINIEISEDESVKRISSRRICERDGRTYNLITNPPPTPDRCVCGGNLIHRDDDKEEIVRKRSQVYKSRTEPLVAILSGKTKLININGEKPIEDIHKQILEELTKRNIVHE